MRTNLRQRLLASTLLVGAVAYAAPAMAQDVPPPPEDPAAQPPSGPTEGQPTPSVSSEGEEVSSGQDIIVTGSRIPQPNLESAAPVTVVSDQDVKLSGATRVEDVLNQLPSVGASQASGVSNGATGTAEVDLRYLGSKRTLSLVNGRRLMPGDPNSTTQAADLNVIPAALIRRVEVLTGGASSVYGADAVAGVVNFIMDTDFEGIRFDGNYSFYWHNQDDPSVTHDLTMSDIIKARQAIAGTEQFPLPTGSVTDGKSFDGTVSLGAGFDDGRGHAVAYFGYRKVKPVLQGDRDYSACVIQNTTGGTPRCGGSATAAPGNAVVFAHVAPNPPDTPGSTITSTVAAIGPGGELTPFSANLFNFGPLNYFQRPDERYIAGAFANYEINETFKPYLEFMFMDDRTLAQIAPSGDFGNTFTINCDNPFISNTPGPNGEASALDVLCGTGASNPNDPQNINLINGFLGNFPLAIGAPFNPDPTAPPLTFFDERGNQFNQAFFQLLRRNVEGGPRISDLRHQSWRGVLGMRGDLNPVFSYDAYFQYGRTNYTQVYKNEFSINRLNRALNAVNIDPVTRDIVPVGTPGSQVVCRSNINGNDPTCVPFNPFGTATPEMVGFLNVFGVIQGITSEQIGNLNFTGLLGEAGVQTPWAEDGVAINAGVEYRRESLDLNPDQEFQTGDLTGQGAPTLPVNGSFRVWEVFGEAQIPIVQHSFIDELSLNLGYRKSWYETSGDRSYDTDTWKVSAEFAPIRDVRFRGAVNRASRAPNIQELFAPQFVGLDGSNDPCTGHAVGVDPDFADVDQGCLAQGIALGASPAANPAGQYNGLLGGNPDLTPEKALTKTVGIVLQPRMVPRLAITVDYWDITLKNAIQGFGADAILNACVTQTTDFNNPAPACALIQRDAAGSIWLTPNGFVRDLPNNEGRIDTNGIDVNASYSHGLFNFGRMSWSFIGTYLNKYKVDNNLSEPYDCAGLYGPTCSGLTVASGAPMPKWRHKLRATWDSPFGLGLSVQWRRVGKVKAETLEDNDTIGGENNFDPGLRIHAENYIDVAATYDLLDRIHLRGGINNLFDNDPPRVTGGNANRGGSNLCPAGPCNGNTYPGTWDALGRYVWLGATIDFLPPRQAPVAPAPAVAPPPPPPAAPATQTCPDGSVILATETCPAAPPPPPPPPPAPERG